MPARSGGPALLVHGIGGRNVLREPDKQFALDASPLGVATVVHQTREAVSCGGPLPEIHLDSFHWIAERAPNGKNWRREVDIRARRAASC